MTRHSRVDTTLSAIITDADSFPPEATTPNKDDQRQGVYPLRIYQGYNYLPTAYGYKSYFGLQATLDASGLVSPDTKELVVEEIFVYQTRAFVNVLVALTSHGIFIRTDADWVHILSMTPPATANTSLPWTIATLSQVMFLYRQGHTHVFVFDDIVDGNGVSMDTFNGMAVTPTRADSVIGQPIQVYEFVPTTINMAGQIGIFRAGGSLGFWDSDDSVAWSAINDFTDFEPSLTTLANTTKLQDQIGAITTILPHGDGFVVYCTRSVLYAREDASALLRYSTRVVLGNAGVAYPREVAVAEPDTRHFAFTSAGLMQIENGRAESIIPDFSDYVKRTRLPQYMTMLNNRYLCITVMDPNFIEGNVEYSTETVDPWDYKYEGSEVGGIDIPSEVIEGDKVCYTIPGNVDPNDPAIIDSGIKPYHLLQFYGQWQYKGANLYFRSEELNGKAIELASIVEGSTDARYNKVPISMKTSEVAAFNDTEQVNALVDRQLEFYADHYKETTLKLQEKWDAYQEAKGALSGQPELEMVGMSIIRVPYITGQHNPAFPSYEARALPYMDYGTSDLQTFGGVLVDSAGDIYVSPNYQYGVKEEGFLSNTELSSRWPEYSTWEGWLNWLTGAGIDNLTCYRWVGNLATTPLTNVGFPPRPEAQIRSWEVPTADIYYQRIDEPSYEIGFDKGYIIDPLAIQNLQPYSVEGAKLAVKVAAPTATALEVSDKKLSSSHKLVRQFPISVEATGFHYPSDTDEPIDRRGSATFEYEDSTGTIRQGGASGQAEVSSYQLGGSLTRTITSQMNQTNDEADATMSAQFSIFLDDTRAALLASADAIYNGLASDVQAQIDQSYQDQVTQIVANGGTITSPLSQTTTTTLPPSQRTGISTIGFNIEYSLANPEYPVIELQERAFVEEEVDITDKLYGTVPDVLPPTDVGAAAINAMSEDTKRGLIAVYQHFYTRNNDTTELDESFLITAAGRVDVPLGASLGSIQKVIDDANFANRYYILDYEGAAPVDEGGATFVVPGQTTEQALMGQQRVVCGVSPDIILDENIRDPIVYEEWQIEVPELTWIMQNGSRAPYNPTLYGAFVYDTHLSKWGVFKGQFKHLVDYQPINNYTPGSVPYKNYMVDGGCLTPSYEVALFNDYPSDNLLRYGKYQHVGSEFCSIEQVHVEFREASTGMVAVQFSLDARRLAYGHSVAKWYNEALSTTLNCDIVGQWATIAFTGHFDIAGLRVKSNPSGRR